MEFLRFCLEIIRREAERFNVGVKPETASQLTAANADDVHYDNAHNRCAFLYRCGTINLSFAKDCFSHFLSECNGIEYLMTKWKSDSCLTFCSITKGPALDYIALLLSHEQCQILTSLIGNIRIISKHGAWRNTANIMLEIINGGYFKDLSPSVGKIEVIQGDPFNNFTEKVKLPINDSDVVMMIKTLNLQSDGYDQTKISKTIQEFLEALKPGAVLFCIDTKPSIKEITQLLTAFSGKYLLKPTNRSTKIDLEYTDLYKNHFGCLPVVSGRGCFFVWEKSSISSMKCELSELSKSLEHTLNITAKKYDNVNSDISKPEFSCNAALSKESKNCSMDLTKHLNSFSTPNLAKTISTSTLDFEISDLLTDNDNSLFQKSSSPLVSDSSVNESVLAFNHFKKESLNACLSSVKSQLDTISNNIHAQMEPEDFSKRNEVAKITELTNKITDLTEELTKLLEDGTLKDCLGNNCTKTPEEIGSSDKRADSCLHSKFLPCSQNFRPRCSQKCFCHESYLSSSHAHNNNNVSKCDETSKDCRFYNSTGSNILTQNISSSTAQLVIPLNNLSPNVVSQIISLITKCKQE